MAKAVRTGNGFFAPFSCWNTIILSAKTGSLHASGTLEVAQNSRRFCREWLELVCAEVRDANFAHRLFSWTRASIICQDRLGTSAKETSTKQLPFPYRDLAQGVLQALSQGLHPRLADVVRCVPRRHSDALLRACVDDHSARALVDHRLTKRLAAVDDTWARKTHQRLCVSNRRLCCGSWQRETTDRHCLRWVR